MTNIQPEPYHRELGQIVSGDVTEAYALPDFATALIVDLLNEYSRVYANHFQDVCPILVNGFYRPGIEGGDGQYLRVAGLSVRSFWWGDPFAHTHPGVEPLEGEAEKPNFEFGPVRIHWYKHVGRGMSTNVSWDANQWASWYDEVIAAIRAADVTL